MSPVAVLAGKRITLGVSGSIAAYKAVALASALHQGGAIVEVAMTPDAQRFVQPLSFQAITHRPVFADLWAPGMETDSGAAIAHVTLGQQSDLLLIAPATAHLLAKLAHGLADDPVAVTALAARCPVVVAPAMDAGMYAHPATLANLDILRQRGVTIVPSEEGYLASGLQGPGRLASVETIVDWARATLGAAGPLAGRTVLVTAGGTREPLDPVRYVSNRSSGRMGYAIAESARDRGAHVILVTGPTDLRRPAGLEVLEIETAGEMLDVLRSSYGRADALIMAAAVADYRAAEVAGQKMKRGDRDWQVSLVPNPDLLAESASWPTERKPVRVGFAAETENLADNASAKLARKQLDLIVGNDVSAPGSGFAVETNQVTLLWADGRSEALPLLAKTEVAERLLDALQAMLVSADRS